MIGRFSPVVGAVTLSSRSTMRSMDPERVTGLIATIGVAGVTGISAALPMPAWSLPSTIPVCFIAVEVEVVSVITGFLVGSSWLAIASPMSYGYAEAEVK